MTVNGEALPPATFACYEYSGGVNLYPFDIEAWRSTHGTFTVPKTATGPIVHLPYASASTTDVKRVIASSITNCTLTSYTPASGSITITSKSGLASSTVITGSVDIVLSAAGGKPATIKGTFTAPVCKTVASDSGLRYDGKSDPAACSGLDPKLIANGADRGAY